MHLQNLIDAWHTFFHAPESCAPQVLFRLLFGSLMLLNAALLVPLVTEFYGVDSMWSLAAWQRNQGRSRLCLLHLMPPTTGSFRVLLLIHVVSFVTFLLGWQFRVSSIRSPVTLLRTGFRRRCGLIPTSASIRTMSIRIRRHGLPIVCGIYPKKGKRELAIHILPGTPGLRFGVHGGLHELLYGGTGFLHVRRVVYETMTEQLALPVCNEHAKRPMWPFFLPLVRSAPATTNAGENAARVGDTGNIENSDRGHNRRGHWYLAEDFAFCHRARLCGVPIIADTTVRL